GAAVATYGIVAVDSTVVMAGLVVTELGLVVCTPTLVGLIARLGRILPLAPRIALRDAARNRAAAAPAISAVMAAVAGAVALGLHLSSTNAQQDAQYAPDLPAGYVAVVVREPAGAETLRGILRTRMPVDQIADVTVLGCGTGKDPGTCYLRPTIPPANQCPYLSRTASLSRADQRAANADPRCDLTASRAPGFREFGTVVDDGGALALLTGATGDDLAAGIATLRAGGVVVLDNLLVQAGTVRLSLVSITDPPSDTRSEDLAVPGYAVNGAVAGYSVIVSPAVAARTGLGTHWGGLVASTTRMPTQAEQDALSAALEREHAWSAVETGPSPHQSPILLILALAAGVITLGAAGIATGLAAADSRADLSTLAAVGASPGVRRILSLSQAGVIAGLGALLGAVAGLGASSAVLFALNRVYESVWPAPFPYPITVPWVSLSIVVLVVPAVAMLGAGLLTRSRLPIERRAG
ncbi:MAG TPA: ABC transporter permease, partial [Micromonosporaceae bacterium]|nr:ABC transporter permease [Micromonosporaceae bacterium]